MSTEIEELFAAHRARQKELTISEIEDRLKEIAGVDRNSIPSWEANKLDGESMTLHAALRAKARTAAKRGN